MSARDVPIIGLAGGIGAGKTAVADILADLGCVVARSDDMGRAALRDPEIMKTLRAWWGDRVFDPEGQVDRGAVASIVFADPAERVRLESLTHPWIEARRRALFDAAPPGTPALVIDAPLLFETGLEQECRAVIFVDALPAVRLARVEANRGWDTREVARREANQAPLDVKRRSADYVVVNDGDLDALRVRVTDAFNRILQSEQPGIGG